MLILFSPQPAPASAGNVNLSVLMGELWPHLNASSAADAIFWTEAELYEWASEALARLAKTAQVFIVYDQSIAAVPGSAEYTLPATHVATLQADLDGTVLRARNLDDLEALDDDYPNTVGDPVAFVLDGAGLVKIRIYPAPGGAQDGLALGQVMHTLPATLSVSAALLSAPSVLREFFRFAIVGEARAKETRAQMPEIAAWCRENAKLLGQVISEYWGSG